MKATILIGLPMSGKSTYAKANKGNAVIIDRDCIRMMLTGEDDKFRGFDVENESIVVYTSFDILNHCKHINKDVIIANTNCNLSKLQNLIYSLRHDEIEFIMIDTPKSVCVSRLPADAQHMIPIIDKFEEEMKITYDSLVGVGINIKIISWQLGKFVV